MIPDAAQQHHTDIAYLTANRAGLSSKLQKPPALSNKKKSISSDGKVLNQTGIRRGLLFRLCLCCIGWTSEYKLCGWWRLQTCFIPDFSRFVREQTQNFPTPSSKSPNKPRETWTFSSVNAFQLALGHSVMQLQPASSWFECFRVFDWPWSRFTLGRVHD